MLNEKGVKLSYGFDKLNPVESLLPFRLRDVFSLITKRLEDNRQAVASATGEDVIDGLYYAAKTDFDLCEKARDYLKPLVDTTPDGLIQLDISRDIAGQLASHLKIT